MKAVVKAGPGPGAELREVEVPRPGPGEVLVKVKAASICGTDYHIYRWDPWSAGRVRPPLVLGHEFCGEVVELGPGVDTLAVGDYVSAESHVVCGSCYQCRTGQAHVCQNTKILGVDRDGCFAEYVVIPAVNAWRNSPTLPPDVASMQEPLGNAVHTALCFPLVGRTVAVVGCGPIGLCAVAISRAAGAARVWAAEVNPYRQELAARVGAHRVIDPRREDLAQVLREETGGLGVDVLLEMSGHPDAIRAGLRGTRSGGEVALLGLPPAPFELDLGDEVVMRGLRVQGITGRKLWQTWYQVKVLLDSGVLDVTPVITHRLPLEEFGLGMELMARGECGKVVLYPGGALS
ncbi:MAG: L-threonine 3-dehydrogenase [Bacillota bacterium]